MLLRQCNSLTEVKKKHVKVKQDRSEQLISGKLGVYQDANLCNCILVVWEEKMTYLRERCKTCIIHTLKAN